MNTNFRIKALGYLLVTVFSAILFSTSYAKTEIEQNNVKIMRQVIQGFSKGNFDVLLENASDDMVFVIHGPTDDIFVGRYDGLAAFNRLGEIFEEAVAIDKYMPDYFLSDGDKVIVVGKKIVKLKTSQLQRKMDFAYIVTFKKGKIVRYDTFQADAVN